MLQNVVVYSDPTDTSLENFEPLHIKSSGRESFPTSYFAQSRLAGNKPNKDRQRTFLNQEQLLRTTNKLSSAGIPIFYVFIIFIYIYIYIYFT